MHKKTKKDQNRVSRIVDSAYDRLDSLFRFYFFQFPIRLNPSLSLIEVESDSALRLEEVFAVSWRFLDGEQLSGAALGLRDSWIPYIARKMLRNFRKDGHNWRKKKDGKTVNEAHEHLKVGNEERIHVYYAHGQENPSFVRRCYWLLDKSQENIVLVHYRETQELQGSPVTPVYSNSSSASESTTPWILSEELDSRINKAYTGELNDNSTVRSHELRLHELNTLEWDELVVANDLKTSTTSTPAGGKIPYFHQEKQIGTLSRDVYVFFLRGALADISADEWRYLLLDSYVANVACSTIDVMKCCQQINMTNVANNSAAGIHSFDNLGNPVDGSNSAPYNLPENLNLRTTDSKVNSNVQRGGIDSLDVIINDSLQSQDSFGKWINLMISDSPSSINDSGLESSVSSVHDSYSPAMDHHQPSLPEQILVTGLFNDKYLHLAKSNLFCICGDVSVPMEIIQAGVYRCWIPPHSPGLVDLYMSFGSHKPISQVVNFEYRQEPAAASIEERYSWDEFQLQMRLSFLLFATKKSFALTSSKLSPDALKEAKKFVSNTTYISKSWQYLLESTKDRKIPFPQAKDALYEIALKNSLKEWLLERIILGCQTTEHDVQGQGVIHLCSILGYTWAVSLFSWSGFSLNFRDKFGWTALHWAAYCGREKMVAALLSAGARPNLVTDPTPEYPGGCTAADLASMKGFDGLAAYLSEKSLVGQFNDMSIAGNISGTLKPITSDSGNSENLNEDQLYIKDTLAAYQTAAEAAARIQAAFREHSFKLRTKAVELSSPEAEVRQIVAAMKIQHAFRDFGSRKLLAAAARIQYTYRTWKMRQQFLHMRRQAIKIQAAYRAFHERKYYRRILWSVGVVEKAILRWRLKRRGLRGLQVNPVQEMVDQREETENDTMEDFYRTSRRQAEERIERSVVRVQAMFRSRKAQEEYRRMKLTQNQAKDCLVQMEQEREELLNSEIDMGRLHQLNHNQPGSKSITYTSIQFTSLFDVLREPPETFTISHLADNTAHEHLQRTDIGVSQIDLALACGEVCEAHVITKLIL
ncbi:calmodulin-binding transcription activator 5-like isoform X1 [Senna tora]|uniref:Calmodulin-binding transcription activator 5-like isoform X1 n=1 Tax=Senna tora TaxID=362788 RepID=A0A834SZH4_9FABA|nr:calmodulin-binding transcription activator 5-like isoform X1 [Senna tora]